MVYIFSVLPLAVKMVYIFLPRTSELKITKIEVDCRYILSNYYIKKFIIVSCKVLEKKCVFQ